MSQYDLLSFFYIGLYVRGKISNIDFSSFISFVFNDYFSCRFEIKVNRTKVYILEFSRETHPIGDIYMYIIGIYILVYILMMILYYSEDP